MNKVWVFGDSFAALHERYVTTETKRWSSILAETLDFELENYGKGGTPLEYSACKFYENCEKMNNGDIVVLCVTDLSRKWVMKDNDNASSIIMLSRLYEHDKITKKDYEFYSRYFAEILNIDIELVHCYNFINSLVLFTLKKKIKLVIIPCFLNEIDGFKDNPKLAFPKHVIVPENNQCLWYVSVMEFKGKEKKLPLKVLDTRANHLSQENHPILADKIYNSLIKDVPLDLSATDFVNDLFTSKDLRMKNPTWNKTL